MSELETLTTEGQLQSLIYQFMNLYDRWSEDRQIAAKKGYDLSKILEEFKKEVMLLSEIDNKIIAKLEEKSDQLMLKLFNDLNKTTAEYINNYLENTFEKINQSALKIEKIIDDSNKGKWLSNLKIFFICILCSATITTFIFKYFMPQPTLPLSSYDMKIYSFGDKFLGIWNKLPQEKKDWFLAEAKKIENKK